MKWIVGSFLHETNTFSTVPTDLEAFRAQTYLAGEGIPAEYGGTRTTIGGIMDIASERGDELVFTVAAEATPSGLVTRDAYDTIVGQMLKGFKPSPKADGVLLALHGAMMADGIDDGEGELLARIRGIVGAEMPVVVVLDLHSHITETMVGQTSALIGYQKYPHTDMYERGVEAIRLIERIARGEVKPVSGLNKPPMIPPCGTCHTQGGLYSELWEEALRADRPAKILTTSLFAGFPYADVASMGFAVLVYADGDARVAQAEADHLAATAWDRREEFVHKPMSMCEAVSRAAAAVGRPVVIADIADNPGGGASNDGVEILRELMRQGVRDAAVATIYDPKVVQQAWAAGIGGTIRTSLGAKTDSLHGAPIEVEGRVRLLFDGAFRYKGPMMRGAHGSVGTSAVLEVGGIRVIVCSERLQSRDPELFRAAGIDPLDMKILVVKSAVHFRAAFEPIAVEVMEADGPGLTSPDMSRFEFKRIRRPMFPIAEDRD